MRKLILCLLITAVWVFSISIFAEEENNDDDMFYKLMTAKTLKFIPQKSCQGDWKKGNLKLSIDNDVTDKEFPQLIFDSIDLKRRTARVISNQGATDAMVILTPTGITFVEQTGFGNLNFTTVFASSLRGTEDYIAVHSRHMHLVVSTPLPSQIHGICRILE